MVFSIPLWLVITVACICIGIYGVIQFIRSLRRVRQSYIEREGQVFMERMAYEKRRKQSM